MRRFSRYTALVVGLSVANIALAQDDDERDQEEEDARGGDLEDTFDPDNKPDAPTVDIPDPSDEVQSLAGVGSGVAYASRGTGEFGGSFSFALANDVTNLSADPSIGWFLWDNIELSGIIGIRHTSVSADAVAVDGRSQTNQFNFLIEPSAHIPFNDGLFWAVGLGGGLALADNVDDDSGLEAGFALAPRTGLQFLVGRSGLLNLGGRYTMVLSNVESDVDALDGAAVLAFANVFDIQAGYTVMF
jgi:hypothetical protein